MGESQGTQTWHKMVCKGGTMLRTVSRAGDRLNEDPNVALAVQEA
jgi:hypothetical protein